MRNIFGIFMIIISLHNGNVWSQKSVLQILYLDNSNAISGKDLLASQLDSVEACLRLCQNPRTQVVTFIRKNDKSQSDTGVVKAQEFVEALKSGQRGQKFDSWTEVEFLRSKVYACIKNIMPSSIEMNFFLTQGYYNMDVLNQIHPLINIFPLELNELWNVPVTVKVHVPRSQKEKRGQKANPKLLRDQADVLFVYH